MEYKKDSRVVQLDTICERILAVRKEIQILNIFLVKTTLPQGMRHLPTKTGHYPRLISKLDVANYQKVLDLKFISTLRDLIMLGQENVGLDFNLKMSVERLICL